MRSTDTNPVAIIRQYLAALQAGVVGDALTRFFTPDALQIELPNRLNPTGQTSDLATIVARSLQGRKVMSSQAYEILSEMCVGDSVAIETRWTGVLAIPFRTIPAGGQMTAQLAMFFECRDGRIRRQRNYDCFDSW